MKLIAASVVAILLIVSLSVIMMNNGNNSVVETDGYGRAMVFGNVDNNDYLDDRDMNELRKIISSNSWDQKANPYADVNNDGKVNDKDIDSLDKILKKEKTKMYYVAANGDTNYVNYPNTGNIAITVDYGLMMAQVLGIYDRVTAGTSKVITYDENRYPGVNGLIDLGTYTKADLSSFVENLFKTDCTLVLGYISP